MRKVSLLATFFSNGLPIPACIMTCLHRVRTCPLLVDALGLLVTELLTPANAHVTHGSSQHTHKPAEMTRDRPKATEIRTDEARKNASFEIRNS